MPSSPEQIKGSKLKKQAFVAAYCSDPKRNATKAAAAAGYSAKTAYATGNKLLKDPEVAAMISAKEEEMRSKYDVTIDTVLRQLSAIVTFDIRKVFNEYGSLKQIHQLDDATAAALASIEVDAVEIKKPDDDDPSSGKIYTTKFKAHDKNSAIEKAMRYLGLLKGNGVSISANKVVISKDDLDLC